MKYFLKEIRTAYENGIYSTALASALIVPDAAGAIEYPNSKNGERYQQFYDNFIYECDGNFSIPGSFVWQLRNAMIHQSTNEFHKGEFDRVLFSTGKQIIHGNISSNIMGINNIPDLFYLKGKSMQLNLNIFISQIINGTENWIEHVVQNDENKLNSLLRLIQFRPNGMPHIGYGIAIIA